MKVSDVLLGGWFAKLHELRADGYDPYNSVGRLVIGRDGISFSWR